MFKITCDLQPSSNLILMVNCQPCYMSEYQLTNTSRLLDFNEVQNTVNLFSRNALNPNNPNFAAAYEEILPFYSNSSGIALGYKYIGVFDFNPNLINTINNEYVRDLNIIYQQVARYNDDGSVRKVCGSQSYLYFRDNNPQAKPGIFIKREVEGKPVHAIDSYLLDYLETQQFYSCNTRFTYNPIKDEYRLYEQTLPSLIAKRVEDQNDKFISTCILENDVAILTISASKDPEDGKRLCELIGGRKLGLMDFFEAACDSTEHAKSMDFGNDLLRINCQNYYQQLGIIKVYTETYQHNEL